MVNHSTTLTRAYSSSLICYLVPLELDHVDHATTTTFAKTKVAKVDHQQAENIAISACSAICLASSNKVGRANRAYIQTSGFKPSANINSSALSLGA